jgi:hypothetical protein
MLQVLPDSDIPNTWVTFEKNPFSSDLPSGCSFGQSPGRVVQPKPYHRQSDQAECPVPASKSADQLRLRDWGRPHECRSRSLGGPSNKKPTVQRQLWKESFGYWRETFGHLEPQPHRMQPYDLQHQSVSPAQCLPADNGRASSIPGAACRRMASEEKCLGPTSQSFDSKSIKAEGLSPTVLHPNAKSNSHLTANDFASFTDTDDGRMTTSGFDCTENSKDNKGLPELGDSSFYQEPGLMNDGADGVSPVQLKDSPDTGSVSTTEDPYLSGPASSSWPAYKVPTQWTIQHQDASPDQFPWASMSCFPNGMQSPSFADTEFDNPMVVNDDISGLPTLGDGLQSTESTLAPSACGSDFNFAFNREQAAMNSSCDFFGAPSFDSVYSDNAYRLDHPMYGTENWPSIRADGGDCRPERRSLRPIPCPGDTRNAFLIECKRRGLSYKDIKKIGGFKEAESTLRGRFRTLTKSKDQRVRKPQWQPRDVSHQCVVKQGRLLTGDAT